MCYQQAIDDKTPDNSAIFLGDSITQLLDTEAVAPHSVNYGIGGLNADQLLTTLPSYKSLDHARAIYLMIGTNDFLQGHADQLPAKYEKIIKRLPPTKALIWSGVMPSHATEKSALQEVNEKIKALCAQRGHCTFLDTAGFLLDETGLMRHNLYRDDVHLTSEGYKPWIAKLQEASATLP